MRAFIDPKRNRKVSLYHLPLREHDQDQNPDRTSHHTVVETIAQSKINCADLSRRAAEFKEATEQEHR